jgi:hypothetical protein
LGWRSASSAAITGLFLEPLSFRIGLKAR